MEYVPGLKPQNETGAKSRRKQKQGRNPVNEPQSDIRLQPAAVTGNYHVRPAQPQRNVKAEQFISALGQISQVSGKLGQYMHEKQTKEAELQASQEIQAMSLEEAGAKVQSGEIGQYDNPYFQDAFQRQFGIRLGLHKGREMRTQFQTDFDPRNDNVDEFIQSHLDPEFEKMMDNPIIQEAFGQTVEEDVRSLRENDYTEKAAAIEQDKMDGAYETGAAQIDKRLENARTPEDRQQAIKEGHQAWRDGYAERRELLGLSNAEQDAITMQLAARYARQGDVDVVEKLLTDDRGGIGSIIDKRGKEGADAHQVLNTAKQNHHNDNKEKSFDSQMSFFDQAREGGLDRDELEEYHKQNPGVYSPAQIQRLITTNESAQDTKRRQLAEDEMARKFDRELQSHRGRVVTETLEHVRDKTLHQMDSTPIPSGIDSETGELEWEMLSPEDRMEMADEVIQNRVLPEYAEQFEEDERGYQTFLYELGLYGNNPDMENEKWKSTMANVGSALTSQAASGEVPPKIESAYALFKNLKTSAPGMLNSSLISERDKDVLEALWYHEQYLDEELDQAVNSVYRMQHTDDDNRFASVQFQEMEQAVNSLDGFIDGWGDSKNDGYVTAEMNRLVRNQWRRGGNSDVTSVTEIFKQEHAWINGHAVPKRGQNVPTDFEELGHARILKYANDHPEEMEERGIDASDLTLYPMGGRGSTGGWAIIQNGSASPMNDMLGSQFTIGDLQRDADDALAEYLQEGVRRANDPGAEVRDNDPRTQGLRESYEEGNSGGAFDTNEARDRLMNPQGESQQEQPAEQSEEGDVWDIEVNESDRVSASEVPMEDRPAQQDGSNIKLSDIKLPDIENEQVKQAVKAALTAVRGEGMTKRQFDQYVKSHMGTDQPGNGLIFNPRLRERIRYYLPAS